MARASLDSSAVARLRRDPARTPPSQLDIAELGAPLIAAFLDHHETDRANSVRTRNMRLAVIHSLLRYASTATPNTPKTSPACSRSRLSAPTARSSPSSTRTSKALFDAPDRSTWTGRCAHALLVLAFQTRLRVSELTGVRCRDIHLTTGPHVRCAGKGRKRRITPLTPTTTRLLELWLAERAGHPDEPAFPTARGRRLTRDALAHRITKYIDIAAQPAPQ